MPYDAAIDRTHAAETANTLDYGRVQVLRLRSASAAPRAMQLPPNTTGNVELLPVRGRLVPPGGTVVTACCVTGDPSVVEVATVLP
jgi:hypothetical protein